MTTLDPYTSAAYRMFKEKHPNLKWEIQGTDMTIKKAIAEIAACETFAQLHAAISNLAQQGPLMEKRIEAKNAEDLLAITEAILAKNRELKRG